MLKNKHFLQKSSILTMQIPQEQCFKLRCYQTVKKTLAVEVMPGVSLHQAEVKAAYQIDITITSKQKLFKCASHP